MEYNYKTKALKQSTWLSQIKAYEHKTNLNELNKFISNF